MLANVPYLSWLRYNLDELCNNNVWLKTLLILGRKIQNILQYNPLYYCSRFLSPKTFYKVFCYALLLTNKCFA